jgi:Cd2+/Zn2+-exporting ATPase
MSSDTSNQAETPHADGPSVAVEIPVVLPHVDDARDQCVDRLLERIAAVRGITQVHLDAANGGPRLCLHYDANLVTLAQVERLVRGQGAQVAARYRHETLRIPDMDCGDCAQSIEHVVGRMPGVLRVAVSYAAESMRVEFDTTHLQRNDIVLRLRSMGYSAEAREPAHDGWIAQHEDLVRALGAGVLLGLAFAAERAGLPALAFGPLYALAYVLGGWELARHGVAAVLHGSFTIDFLMTLAALGAAALGHWADGGLLLFLFGLGHALEEEAFARARRAVGALEKVAPRSARVRRDGVVSELRSRRSSAVTSSSYAPASAYPVDGRVESGTSEVDESMLTGESVPVAKAIGATVLAGTVNLGGALEVVATKLAGETTLARVMRLVAEAETQKSPTELLVDRFARVFVPLALAVVAALAIAVPLLGWLPWSDAFLRATAVLVAASPCALAIATPAAVLSGIACAARRGVLIKGGVHLENLGRIRAIAFDKTGTLTGRRPEVTEVFAVEGASRAEVLAIAAAVERRSTHPLARAIVSHAASAPAPGADLEASSVEQIPGVGVRGELGGEMVYAGGRALLAGAGIPLPDAVAARLDALESARQTVVLIARGVRVVGLVGAADRPRATSESVLESLRALGIVELAMLTGDQPRVAAAVAAAVGITDVRAGLLPDEKLAAVRELLARVGPTAMVGDGVNDAPALATATVGIAMGAAGSDVALETADVALMGDDLTVLPFAIALGRSAGRVIRQNLADRARRDRAPPAARRRGRGGHRPRHPAARGQHAHRGRERSPPAARARVKAATSSGRSPGSAGSEPASSSSRSRKPSSSRSRAMRVPEPGGTQVKVRSWPAVRRGRSGLGGRSSARRRDRRRSGRWLDGASRAIRRRGCPSRPDRTRRRPSAPRGARSGH